ncbi:MAG: ABC transporter ATP-binding protein [Leifsonia sp.]|jgi:branched-chain amino acid transport system ATP-binding protein|uniref:ABC transporter ATP-binding protein n=1 Tax=Microcella pacifica TaxID=2591847 RepID=A0A9E5MEU1_9MICO|nr:ABC transporter ATP-binding protein [Microcella pacifica]MBR21468.1 ABC transporter ATP-binding protein [Leifsonia sp.]NHF62912.1 ABC transporter ATP-binding protein [Microcella pacifica]
MTDQPVLAVEHLELQIGGARIIDDVTLSVGSGEMLGVIGPNGAGKTTLFNLMSGIMTPTGGRVLLRGDDVTRLTVQRRARAGLGRTFQTSSLFTGLSALENVRLSAQVSIGHELSVLARPRRGDAATSAAEERLEEVGLAHHAQTMAGVLSHGDKRKLEIAMLLATEPSVILLDEPMAGVASGDVPELVEVIRRVHRSGRTVLMVEHHMDVVLGLVDTVAVMHHGQVLAWDTPQAVMADPTVQSAYLGESL